MRDVPDTERTPGPWRVVTGVCHHDHPDTSADVLGPDNVFIANCGCHPAAIANAHAIAALPGLVLAVVAAYHALQSYAYGNASPDLARACAAALDDAFKRVEGRTDGETPSAQSTTSDVRGGQR